MFFRRLFQVALFLCLAPFPAWAHPHVWVDATITVVFQGNKVEALQETWVFDDIFSDDTLQDLAPDHTSAAFQKDLLALAVKEQKALAEVGYFTDIYRNGQPVPIVDIRDFRIDLVGNRLVYRFTAPVAPALDPTKAPFGFAVYDHSYFVDVSLAKKNPLLMVGQGALKCVQSVKDDPAHTFYFGQVVPKVVWVSCQ